MSTLQPPTLNGSSALNPNLPSELNENQQLALDLAWLKVEDGFDSIPGGPHLLELSKQGFGHAKAALLFPFAMRRINYGQPPLEFTLETFPYNPDVAILADALSLELILHLIRSYAEDPLPSGSGNFSYLSRRDYTDRWLAIYDREEILFKDALIYFRRKYLNLGRSKGIFDWSPNKGFGGYPQSLRLRGYRYPRW